MLPDLTFQEISFRSGDVLTKEMLNVTYAYPRIFLALRYQTYGDGILCGLDYQQGEDGHIYLTPGIIKWQDKYFFLQKPCDLTERLLARQQHGRQDLQLVLVPAELANKIVLQLEVVPLAKQQAGIELGRCRYEAGDLPKLPKAGIKQADELKEFWRPAVFNVLAVPQAVAGGTTLPAIAFRALRNLLEQKEQKNTFDVMLLMQLQALPVLPLAVLRTYAGALGFAYDGTSRQELLNYVLKAMQKTVLPTDAISTEKSKQEKKKQKKGPWMI